MRLHDAHVLITGSSRGLGAALAMAAAQRGARVTLAARPSDDLRATKTRLTQRGHSVQAIETDLADPRQVHALALGAVDTFGPVDVLVHNASTLGAVPMPLWLDTTDDVLAHTLAVNLMAPVALTRWLVPAMVLAGRGDVVTISSDAAVESYPTWGAYGASKAALDHVARTLAAELDGSGVRVFAVDPGEMDTAMHAAALPDADPATLTSPDAVAAVIAGWLDDAQHPSNGARLSVPSPRGAA